tara:strand:- start:25966 stop:27654 length:1689 start_codon:yes stop_codon:yes gene_type:complete
MDIRKELVRCRGTGFGDIDAFLYSLKYLYIKHKRDLSKVCLADVITPLQVKTIREVASTGWVYILKSRKEGISTIYAAWNFRHAWLVPNFETLLLSLDDASCTYIKTIYQYFHDNLPKPLRLQEVKSNDHQLWLDQGNGCIGKISARTAKSEGTRGTTPRSIHASEFAQYTNIQATLDAAFNAAADDCEIMLESTARGMNQAYDIWNNPDNGYKKLFIGWHESPNCTLDELPKGMRVPTELLEVQEQEGFSNKRIWWAAERYHRRCGSNWNQFCQEYPWKPEVAFVSTGTRFFTSAYFTDTKPTDGLIRYHQPHRYRIYSMGVDTASGSTTGDYSAFHILDVTIPTDPFTVCTYRGRLQTPQYASLVYQELVKYQALAVVEINGYGLDVHQRIMETNYPNIYRRQIYDKSTKKFVEKLGWTTSDSRSGGGTRSIMLARMLSHIRGGMYLGVKLSKFKVIDERLKDEINTVIYTDSGKVEHDKNCYDDLVIATALAMMGIDQTSEIKDVIHRTKPRSIAESLKFEADTGLLLSDLPDGYFDGDEDPLSSTGSPMPFIPFKTLT